MRAHNIAQAVVLCHTHLALCFALSTRQSLHLYRDTSNNERDHPVGRPTSEDQYGSTEPVRTEECSCTCIKMHKQEVAECFRTTNFMILHFLGLLRVYQICLSGPYMGCVKAWAWGKACRNGARPFGRIAVRFTKSFMSSLNLLPTGCHDDDDGGNIR